MTLPHNSSNVIKFSTQRAQRDAKSIERMIEMTVKSMEIASAEGHEFLYFLLRAALIELQTIGERDHTGKAMDFGATDPSA